MPEGHIYTGAISVVQFIRPDGQQGYAIVTSEGLHLATTIGYLELAKVNLIRNGMED